MEQTNLSRLDALIGELITEDRVNSDTINAILWARNDDNTRFSGLWQHQIEGQDVDNERLEAEAADAIAVLNAEFDR
jgi:hypothetical protein